MFVYWYHFKNYPFQLCVAFFFVSLRSGGLRAPLSQSACTFMLDQKPTKWADLKTASPISGMPNWMCQTLEEWVNGPSLETCRLIRKVMANLYPYSVGLLPRTYAEHGNPDTYFAQVDSRFIGSLPVDRGYVETRFDRNWLARLRRNPACHVQFQV